MKLKIQGTKFSRDLTNMAIVCSDKSEVTKYQMELQKHKENVARDNEINKLKNEISEMKEIMHALIRGQNAN